MNNLFLKIAINKLAQEFDIHKTMPNAENIPTSIGGNTAQNIPGAIPSALPYGSSSTFPQTFKSPQSTTIVQDTGRPATQTPAGKPPRIDYGVSLSHDVAGKNIFEEKKKDELLHSKYLEFAPDQQPFGIEAKDVIPELKELYNKLLNNDPTVTTNFQQKLETYRAAAPHLQDLTNLENVKKLRDVSPELYQSALWLHQVANKQINPYANPEAAKAHLQRLWEFGAFNHATKGFTYDINDPYARQLILQRYMDVFNKAMGDKKLDMDDLNYVYSNFANTLDLDPSNFITQNQFAEWWSSNNVNPLFKVGMLLGVPLLAIGLVSGLFKGFSTGSVLMTLLGLTGLGAGIYGYMQFSQQQRNVPKTPATATELQDILSQFGIQPPIQLGIQPPIQQVQPIAEAGRPETTQANPTNLLGLMDAARKGFKQEEVPVMAQTLNQFADVIDTILSKPTTGTFWGEAASHLFGTQSGLGGMSVKSLRNTGYQLRSAATTLQTSPVHADFIASQLTEQREKLLNSLNSLARQVGADPDDFYTAILSVPPEKILEHIQPHNTAEDALRSIADLGRQYRVEGLRF